MNEKTEASRFDLFNFDIPLQELLGRAVKTELEEAQIYRNLLEEDLPEKTISIIEKIIHQGGRGN